MASKNYYEEIGVSPNATIEEITNAVRQNVKANNPDNFTDVKDREAAQQRLRLIKQIYETLKDENLRWEYDVALFDESEKIDFSHIDSINVHKEPKSLIKKLKLISILIFGTVVVTAVTTAYLSNLNCNSQRNALDGSICEKTQSIRSLFESDEKPVIAEKSVPTIVEKPIVTEEFVEEIAPEIIDTFQVKNLQNETNLIDESSTNSQCYDLWYKRNLIYAENGYCFESNLGKSAFKDFNCFTTSQNLSSSDKRKVDNIKSRENALDCKIDTSAATIPTFSRKQSVSNFSYLAETALKTLFGKSDNTGSVKTSGNKLANIWFERKFHLNNQNYYSVFIYENDLDETGDALKFNGQFIPIDTVTFSENHGSWELVSAQKSIVTEDDGIGNYGSPIQGTAETIRLPNGNLLIMFEDEVQSETSINSYVYHNTYKHLFLFENSRWQYLGHIVIASSNDGYSYENMSENWTYTGDIKLLNNRNSLPDLKIKKSGTELNESETAVIPAKDDVYRFNGKRYTRIE